VGNYSMNGGRGRKRGRRNVRGGLQDNAATTTRAGAITSGMTPDAELVDAMGELARALATISAAASMAAGAVRRITNASRSRLGLDTGAADDAAGDESASIDLFGSPTRASALLQPVLPDGMTVSDALTEAIVSLLSEVVGEPCSLTMTTEDLWANVERQFAIFEHTRPGERAFRSVVHFGRRFGLEIVNIAAGEGLVVGSGRDTNRKRTWTITRPAG
jgi:hypothetical protein